MRAKFNACLLAMCFILSSPGASCFAAKKGSVSKAATQQEQDFKNPMLEGARVDYCYTGTDGCGQKAAQAFCKKMEYGRATGFEPALAFAADQPKLPEMMALRKRWKQGLDTPPVKNYTYVMSSGEIIQKPIANGFKSVHCAK